jgi:heme A synthase
MRFIHIALGIAILVTSLATLVVAFLPKVKDETFDALSSTVAGLLIVQIVVGFFLFTSQTNENFNAFLHILPPVIALAAILGARATQGDRRRTLVALAGFLVLVAAAVSYLSGLVARGTIKI